MPKTLSNICDYSSQVLKQVLCQARKTHGNVNCGTFFRDSGVNRAIGGAGGGKELPRRAPAAAKADCRAAG
jgi:hypothetical protein